MSADHHIKRINPRRPYLITEAGIKRIILGATDGLTAHSSLPSLHQGITKPLRTPAKPKTHVLAIAHSDRGML